MNQYLNKRIELTTERIVTFNKAEKEKLRINEQKQSFKIFEDLLQGSKEMISWIQNIRPYLDEKEKESYLKILTDLETLVIALDSSVEKSNINAENFKQISFIYKTLKKKIKELWKNISDPKVKTVMNMFSVIRGSMSDKIKNFEVEIREYQKQASDIDKSVYIGKFFRKISEAEDFVKQLNIDGPVSDFFIKMNKGQATVYDLTPEIMEWIRNNNFSRKIKLTF